MSPNTREFAIWMTRVALGVLICCGRADAAEPPKSVNEKEKPEVATGPATEKRFPPLVVPEGFKATLFTCDPLVEYPSVISLGPRPKTLFVAHDYMTGLGVEIVRRDEIRVIEDTDGDGYADKSTVFAKGFNSIQGLAFFDREVFVMHAPLLTSLRDTDGDDMADERRDLIQGLGLPPEENSNRLHCANGVVAGHDGWLYLALGDRGCDVVRPEGDRLLFQEGGILRCRRNGSDLHVFSTGLRNIYDIALDEDLNVFVRDNENDGGDYMIRVCHCFHGSDHGYPYHYYVRPDEAMRPLADLGRGSSAGVTTYLETAFPKEFRDSLFCCEWGRAIVRYRLRPADSGYDKTEEIEFAAGAPDDPYGFKPTDLVVDRDGSLLISDWCDGQRPKRGRARIYRITHKTDKEVDDATNEPLDGDLTIASWIAKLNSDSYHERVQAQLAVERSGEAGYEALMGAIKRGDVNVRGRLHAVWAMANTRGADAIDDLFLRARIDSDLRVRVQAIRAIADLTDPILVSNKLDAGRGNGKIAERLATLRVQRDPRLLRDVIIALGRLKWKETPRWIFLHLTSKPDAAITHAAAHAFRVTDNWPYVFTIWDNQFTPSRPAAIMAAAEQANTVVVDALLERCTDRAEYAELLSRVYKKPGDYQYWGFRPAPRPAGSISWERTEAIEKKLTDVFARRDRSAAKLRKQILREGIPIPIETLIDCLKNESDEERLAVVLDVLRDNQDKSIADHFANVVRSKQPTDTSRITALKYLIEDLDDANERVLFDVAQAIEDGEVLAEAIEHLGTRRNLNCDRFLITKLQSPDGAVRSAATRALAHREHRDAIEVVVGHLDDPDVRVRRAAAFAVGKLDAQDAGKRLLALAGDQDVETRRLSLDSLREIKNAGGVSSAVAALKHPDLQLSALAYLARFGDPHQQNDIMEIAKMSRSIDVLSTIVQTLSKWEEIPDQESKPLCEAVSEIQGRSGIVMRWTTFGPLTFDEADGLVNKLLAPKTTPESIDMIPVDPTNRRTTLTTETDARIVFDKGENDLHVPVFVAVAHLKDDAEKQVEFIGSSDGDLQVWLNSKSVFKRDSPKFHPYQPNTDQFDAVLPSGMNRLVARIDGTPKPPQMHLRFREKSSKADHERLIKLALAGRGNVNRGREVFAAADKSQCVNCHRIGEQGGRIGPDLAGIGSRFSRIHLIESILEPSRTVAPSYGSISIALTNGRVLSGVKVKEDEESLTLGDNQGKIHEITKSTIDEIRLQPKSTMPDGLEKKLTDREFIDLLAFLLSKKKR